MAYGLITGIQPNGTMCVRNIPVGSPGFGNGLEGFPDVEIIQIEYNFPSGIQGPEHPCPGRRYTGTRRVAYLPATKEGEEVLSLLKTAWDRRLLFSVGNSITTGQRDVVTWSGVHHKTSTWGGPSNFGYPDPTYFARVKAELAEKGVK
jgi:deltex-like protein